MDDATAESRARDMSSKQQEMTRSGMEIEIKDRVIEYAVLDAKPDEVMARGIVD